ncbi:MAG: hypothetical protein O3A85_02030 [Proteobacteria bacterium]|nr:hypothetical protein [Pseudomonadota bacterium]
MYLAVAVLALIDAFVHLPQLVPVTAGLIVLFIVLQFRQIPFPQKIAGLVLTLIGLIGAAASDHWAGVVIDGIARSRIFLLLFFAVSWLQLPVKQSPSMQAARETIVSQPPGRRFMYMSFGVHVLGSVLNLAGLGLLSTMVEGQKDPHLRRRMTMALINGFGSASCWSPFFIGMIVVLVAIPTLSWRDIGPLGIILALTIITIGWLYDRLVLRAAMPSEAASSPVAISRQHFWRTAALLGSLVGLTIAVVDITGTSIPVTLGLMGPPFAIFWYMSFGAKGTRFPHRAKSLTYEVMKGLPTLRNEVLVFVAANILGVGLSSAIPSQDVAALVNAVLPWTDAKVIAIILFFLITSMIGLHAVIVVIALSSILPPEAIGMRDWVMGLTYVGVWGLSTMVSPFSGTTLYMSRVTGVPAHIIGWRWMAPTAFLNGAVIAGIIIAIRHLI